MDAEPSGSDGENGSRFLYFERQQAALCGVHALNTLLQGPYFTEIDCAEVREGLWGDQTNFDHR